MQSKLRKSLETLLYILAPKKIFHGTRYRIITRRSVKDDTITGRLL
jgi:hypothetical protein